MIQEILYNKRDQSNIVANITDSDKWVGSRVVRGVEMGPFAAVRDVETLD